MNQPLRHDLDAAIDRVAERMVAVPEDSGLLARTIERLPERQATPWFLAMRVQVIAAAAVVLVAFLYARPAQELSRPVASQVAVTAPASTPVVDARIPDPAFAEATADRPGSRVPDLAAAPVARQAQSRPLPPVVDRADHDRSLAPVDAIDALELVGIAPLAMELDAATSPAPLVVPELALDTKGDS
jgi:hypothetical protein